MGLLVDTTVFIDLERSAEALETTFGDEEIYLAAVSASELLHGVHRADTAVRRAKRDKYVEGILSHLPILVFDLAVARVYAQVWSDLRAAGVNIGAHDLQIGATALFHELTVLTANVRDFNRIPGLQVRCTSAM